MTKNMSSRIEEIPIQRVWTPEARWPILQDSQHVAQFLFPAFGRGNYNDVVRQVMANRERGAHLPTGEQLAFMLREAYDPRNEDGAVNEEVKNNPRANFVREDIMRNGWLWVPSVNVWTPKNTKNPGMYSVFDKNGEGLARKYTTDELEDRLSGSDTERGVRLSQDGTVAFAPRNTIKSGEHKKGTLAKDGAHIAVYRPNGAEALDKVAEQFLWKPYSWIVDNNSNENIQTLAALGRDGDLGGYGLYANFISDGDDRDGYVVSVSGSKNSAEGDAPKK